VTPVEARLLLSDREWEAMSLKKKGLKCSEIARRLGITENTVKNLIAASNKKLGGKHCNHNIFSPKATSIHRPCTVAPGAGFPKTERERLAEDLAYGKAAFAYRRHVTSNIEPTSEDYLTGGINGICSRKVLLKKRCEARNVITLTAKYKIIKTTAPIGAAMRLELEWSGIRSKKTNVDDNYADPGGKEIVTRHYQCKSASDFTSLASAINADILNAAIL